MVHNLIEGYKDDVWFDSPVESSSSMFTNGSLLSAAAHRNLAPSAQSPSQTAGLLAEYDEGIKRIQSWRKTQG